MNTFKSILIAAPALVILDLLWIGALMAPFYQGHLRPLLNFVDGKLEPRLVPWVLTYVAMIALVVFVAVPLARAYAPDSSLIALAVGALIGILVYGLYNFTNLTLLRDWSLAVTIVDTIWGGILFAIATWATRYFS